MGMNDTLPGKSPQFQLADLGYDVYLGHQRGTEYSKGHAFLDLPSDNPEAYWNFSFDEMGLDVIAFSEAMVANASGDATKGYFIGHSQGTIAAFTAMTRYQSDFD